MIHKGTRHHLLLHVRCCLLSVVSCRPDAATIYLPHNPLAKFEERVAESTLSSVYYQFQTLPTNVFEGETSDPTRGVIRLIECPTENMIPVVCEVAAHPPARPSPRKTPTLPSGWPRASPASKTMVPSMSRPRKSGKDSPTRLVVQGIQSPEFPCFIVKAAFGKRVCDGMEKAQSYILDLKGKIRVTLRRSPPSPERPVVRDIRDKDEQYQEKQQQPVGAVLLFASDVFCVDKPEILAYLTRPSVAEAMAYRILAQAEISPRQLRDVCILPHRIHREQQGAKKHREEVTIGKE
ncbi:hypothetical protein LZ32DRAFT_662945 [Colletotrichum eremochloae]|nr:hypothetical protein LZ32DRAFT_662945 [Colletotrichum eremochloae]